MSILASFELQKLAEAGPREICSVVVFVLNLNGCSSAANIDESNLAHRSI